MKLKINFKILIFFILQIQLISFGQTKSDYELALCGKKPSTTLEEQIQEDNLNKIAKEMPPIDLQNPANTCYAFAVKGALDYHLFLNY